jgi:hypothetical protein
MPIKQRTAMICLGFDGLPYDKTVSVSLRISIDQIHFVNIKQQFVRSGLNNLSFVYPQSGPVDGGTNVIILGSGFRSYFSNLNSPLCKFSATPSKGYTVAGQFISDSSLLCVSPSARAPYPAIQLAPAPLSEVTTTIAVSLDGSGYFCLEPCKSLMLGQEPCSDPAPQTFTFAAPTSVFLEWVHCSLLTNGCPRPLGMEKLGYISCFFQPAQVISSFLTLGDFSKHVCIRAMPSSAVR